MSNPFDWPTSSVSSSTTSPDTPSRPPRSLRRVSVPSPTSRSVPDLQFLPVTSSSPSPFSDSRAHTSAECTINSPSASLPPIAYNTSRPSLPHRKSSSSIRRKPVPRSLDHLNLDVPDLPSFIASAPARSHRDDTPLQGISRASETVEPVYVLPVDPPSYPSTPSHPSYTISHPNGPDTRPYTHVTLPRPSEQGFDLDPSPIPGAIVSMEELPRYAEEKETEPKTLARSLWRCGWFCPLLWAIGMCILWIPLRPEEEEADAEKAQKLEEMIVILRETELKYAKRCLWGFCGFIILLVLVVALAVVLSRVL